MKLPFRAKNDDDRPWMTELLQASWGSVRFQSNSGGGFALIDAVRGLV